MPTKQFAVKELTNMFNDFTYSFALQKYAGIAISV